MCSNDAGNVVRETGASSKIDYYYGFNRLGSVFSEEGETVTERWAEDTKREALPRKNRVAIDGGSLRPRRCGRRPPRAVEQETLTTCEPSTRPPSVIAGVVVVVVLAGGCVGPDDGNGAACGTGEPAPTAGADDGEVFTNSQGTYRMTIDREWTADHGRVAEGIDLWYLGPAPETPDPESEALNPERSFTLDDIQREAFRPNVNVFTQRTDGETLDEYLDLSEQSAPPGFAFTSREIVEGVNHPELGVLDYREAGAGFTLCFLGVVAVRGDRAVVATLTAPDDDVPALRRQVEPYLLTLEPT